MTVRLRMDICVMHLPTIPADTTGLKYGAIQDRSISIPKSIKGSDLPSSELVPVVLNVVLRQADQLAVK